MDEITKDERFKDILKDQRFKILPKNERKVKIDKRFKKMFHDKKFKLKYTVDKRGRPTNLTTNDNLKKYYELSSEEEEGDEDDEDKKGNGKKRIGKKKGDEEEEEKEREDNQTTSEDESEEQEKEIDKEDSDGDGKDDEEEESEDESDSDDESSVQQEIEIPWNELDKDTIREDKVSSRLAVCNLDWDRIKAVDLYVLFNSFKPVQGVIKSIKIYISEYGKERIEYEKMHGPKELRDDQARESKNKDDQSPESSEDDEEDEEGNDFDMRKLRIYQFNRLRYYYAIIDCDTTETAEKIYSECDGMEYESSSNRLDLRFVPDDTEFDAADVRDECTEAPDPITYKPNLYLTTALTQTRVECTWDETSHDRLALTMKKYTEDDLKNSDFRGIVATSSEEEEDEEEENAPKTEKPDEYKHETEEERIRRYRELLLGSDKKSSSKQRDGDLEFDWNGGDIEDGFNQLLFNENRKSNQKNFKKRTEEKKELTEDEKKEHAQLSLLTMDEEDNRAHFNLDDLLVDKKGKKTSKSKLKDDEEKKAQDDFKLNLEDPRFQAVFSDYQFNIDPSDQSFKKTKAMENLLEEKIKRMEKSINKNAAVSPADQEVNNSNKKSSVAVEESLLIKSIKSKTEVLKRKKEENEQKLKKIKTKKF